MKTIVTDRLTRSYLQKLDRQNYFATTSFVVIIIICVFWSLFHIGGDQGVNLLSNIMYPLTSAIGACWAFMTANRARRGPLQLERHLQLAWLLVGLGLLANCFGGIDYTYLEQVGIVNPVPSVCDIGFTLFYPLTFAALLIMPPTLRFRKRFALDAVITTLCVLGISWFFFISTIFFANAAAHERLNTLIVTLSYPVWDMLLILAIALLIQRRTEPILHMSLTIFAAGILCQIWADTGYAYTIAIDIYSTGTLYIDPFWFMGFLLFGLSALYQYSMLARRAYNERTLPVQLPVQATTKAPKRLTKSGTALISLQSALIYLPFIFLLILTLYSDITKNEGIAFFLVLLTAIVGILITFRYLLATRENEILLEERERGRQESERLRILNTALTGVLEFDRLLEHVVTAATTELGFDAAILIIIDDYNLSLSAQSRLLVRAATSGAPEVNSWRLQGASLAKCSILLGVETDVIWSEQTINLPLEIEIWHQVHHIRTALFIPLIYRGKILGSLGFASRAEQHFNLHEHALAKTFTEQVAMVIEHTYLYQTACEQETFAKAMATIAARLNAAVVVPAEIHQLICTEAANALRADYALLYSVNDGEQLKPVAIGISEQEPQSRLEDWPPIFQHEYEGQALASLQPILIQLHTQHALPDHKMPESPSFITRQKKFGMLPTREIDGYSISSLREKLAQHSAHTAILAPLIAGGDALGLLVLARSLPPGGHGKTSFVVSDLSHAQDFAEQAAVALTNAQLYQRLRMAHQQLQELDQLKDQFMITASHELRTPLTAVQGYIELLAQYEEVLPGEQRREFLQKAQRSCDELVVLLHNVMDASRLEIEAGIRSTHTEPILVQDIIDSVLNLIEPQLTQEQREVHLSIPAHLCVQADAGRLRQVLVNLSVNALKYSPPQTPIAFSALPFFDQNRYIIISIIDKGKGITSQDQTRLFERFVRLESDINSPIRGSGLGLYISRRLIEAMNGRIWIESSGIPGEGSTFHIELPAA